MAPWRPTDLILTQRSEGRFPRTPARLWPRLAQAPLHPHLPALCAGFHWGGAGLALGSLFWSGDTGSFLFFQWSHPLSPSSPPALNLSQHQGLFQRVDYSYLFMLPTWIKVLPTLDLCFWELAKNHLQALSRASRAWSGGSKSWGLWGESPSLVYRCPGSSLLLCPQRTQRQASPSPYPGGGLSHI